MKGTRKEKGKVEAQRAGIDSTVEFQRGEHDRGLGRVIEYINRRIVLEIRV